MSVYKVTSGLNTYQDHKAAAENSEKNRDQFQFLYVSRLMIATVASFLAVFGIAMGGLSNDQDFSDFAPTLWLLFFAMFFALLAGYWTAVAFVEQTKQNRCANNAQSYLNAGFQIAKEREKFELINLGAKQLDDLLKTNVPEVYSLEGYDLRIKECADQHLDIGLQGLRHKQDAQKVFNYVEKATEFSTALFLLAFFVPLIGITLSNIF